MQVSTTNGLRRSLSSSPDDEWQHDPDSELLPLKQSSNVLLLSRLNDLKTMSLVNFSIAICCLVYLAINITCIILNSFDNDTYGEPGSDAVTTKIYFHTLEFWATFAFSVAEVVGMSPAIESEPWLP